MTALIIDGKPAALPREIVARKPAHDAPCNACGVCCMVTRCRLSQHVFDLDEAGACPALVPTGAATYGCGLVIDPRKYAPARAMTKGVGALRRAALFLIASGAGCDARIHGEPRDEAFAAALDRRYTGEGAKEARRAKIVWGASPDD